MSKLATKTLIFHDGLELVIGQLLLDPYLELVALEEKAAGHPTALADAWKRALTLGVEAAGGTVGPAEFARLSTPELRSAARAVSSLAWTDVPIEEREGKPTSP